MNLIESPNTTVKFSYKIISAPEFITFAKTNIPLTGTLIYLAEERYCYLKVHDDLIFRLFGLIKNIDRDIDIEIDTNMKKIEKDKEKITIGKEIKIPDYFPPKMSIGAHISIIYPIELEGCNIQIDEINQCYSFDIAELLRIEMDTKTIYALYVISEELSLLRAKYKLPLKLNYRGYLVPFHITIAVSDHINSTQNEV